MNIDEILIWESTNLLLLIPAMVGLVMLTARLWWRRVFTERDWLFPFGHSPEKMLSIRFWLEFAALWLFLLFVGLALGYYLVP